MIFIIFGYARVSTIDQNLDMQIDALEKYGCEKIFKEKITGAKRDRHQLEELIQYLRSGDQIVVYKLDRISRSTKHLLELVELFQEKEVDFISIQDKIDTSSAMGRFFFRTMASIAELERDIIRERTKAGLESARARGKKGGRPQTDKKKIELALKMYKSKSHSISEITNVTGLSKTTIYRYLKNDK